MHRSISLIGCQMLSAQFGEADCEIPDTERYNHGHSTATDAVRNSSRREFRSVRRRVQFVLGDLLTFSIRNSTDINFTFRDTTGMWGSPSDMSLIRRYYLYRATLSVGFVTPIFTLFLLRSLTFTQVGTLSALYAFLSVVGEIPTGYIGDWLGRRASLLLSIVFTVGSLAGFIIVDGFIAYAVLYALWALALTFRTGSLDAWLYDILDERLDTDRFSHVRGRGDAVQKWIGMSSMILGGLLYSVNPVYPFVAAVAFNSLGVVTLLSLPKNHRYTEDGDGGELDPLLAVSVIRNQLARPSLRSFVLYVGLFYAITSASNTFVQPMAIETLGPYANGLGVQFATDTATVAARSGDAGPALAAGLGILYAVLTAVSSIGGFYAGAIEQCLGIRRVLLVVPLVTALALTLPLWLPLFAVPAFAFNKSSTSILQPIATGHINDAVGTVGRATVLSAFSMLYMLLRAPLVFATGAIADSTSATAAVAVLGCLFVGGGGLIWTIGSITESTRSDTESRSGHPNVE